MTINETNLRTQKKPIGCGLLILAGLGTFWMITASVVDLFLNWLLEQTMFETSVAVADFRWVNHAICSILMLLAAGILALTVKHPRIKKMFSLWMLGAILAVFAIPLKMVSLSAQKNTALLQLAALAVLGAGFLLVKNKISKSNPEKRSSFNGIHILFCGFICVPWFLWGALGSATDTILELLVGILFAFVAVEITFTVYLQPGQFSEDGEHRTNVFLDGVVVAVFLLIMTAALAHNGSQQMWVLTVPISGWLLALSAKGDPQRHEKFEAGVLLALLVALPVLFFDMDELSSIYTGGKGEILDLALKSAWFTLIGVITYTSLRFTARRSNRGITLSKKVHLFLSGISVAGAVIVYLVWGQPGFFGDYKFIVLRETTDLTRVEEIFDYEDRKEALYSELIKTANDSQQPLREKLDQWHLAYTPYYLLNGIEVKDDLITSILFKNDPAVDRILESPRLRPISEHKTTASEDVVEVPVAPLWNISMIHADQVVAKLGVTGSGIIIGQADSGVDGHHPELAAAYRGVDSGDDYNWYDPWNNTPFPSDHSGHGTMTLGVVLGSHVGVAPGAQWIGCVNLDRNLGNPARYLDCMQFMFAPFPRGGDAFTDGDPTRGAMVINNSWGCPDVEGCDALVFETTAAALKTAGIFMSVSAGNSGYYGCSTVTDPLAIYSDVFTVGSINQQGELSDFSSIGPVLVDGSQRSKPDLVAPGEGVLSSIPGGGYEVADGTSFSAPHVTGVVALMWSANPILIGNVDATMAILRESATPYHGSLPACGAESNAVGSGILDAYKAVQFALEYQ